MGLLKSSLIFIPEDDVESMKIVESQHNLSQIEPCPRLHELSLLLLCTHTHTHTRTHNRIGYNIERGSKIGRIVKSESQRCMLKNIQKNLLQQHSLCKLWQSP